MFFTESDNKLYINTPGALINPGDLDKETAGDFTWAAESMTKNPLIRWVLAKYVEADRPNNNGQMWSFADLVDSRHTIKYTPMNILHRPTDIVGAWIDNQMIYPLEASGEIEHPYIEVLGALWTPNFPEIAALVDSAFSSGNLFISMECVAESLTFRADGREETYDYLGPKHPSYGDIQNIAGVTKQLNKPHFLGGALIFPPVKPGWNGANVTDLARSIIGDEKVDEITEGIKKSVSDLNDEEFDLVVSNFLTKRFTEIASAVDAFDQESLIEDNNMPNNKSLENTFDLPQGGVTMENTELQAANAKIAELEAKLSELEAAQDAQKVEDRIAELQQSHETDLEAVKAELASVKAELDTATLKAEQSEAKYTELVDYLDAEEASRVAAEEAAARKDERVAKVKEIAKFSDEYITKRENEWAELSDEHFEVLLEDLKAVASADPVKPNGADATPPRETAMSGSEDNSNVGKMSVADMIRDGVDFRNLR